MYRPIQAHFVLLTNDQTILHVSYISRPIIYINFNRNHVVYLNTLHYSLNNISLYDTVCRQFSVLEQDKACTATLSYGYSKRVANSLAINYASEELYIYIYTWLSCCNMKFYIVRIHFEMNMNQRISSFLDYVPYGKRSYSCFIIIK